MAQNLAPVFLNDSRVTLQGDPRPKVSKIIQAGGMQANATIEIKRLKSQDDTIGTTVRLDDVIDRTTSTEAPVYLKCIDSQNPASAGRKGMPATGGGFHEVKSNEPYRSPTVNQGYGKGGSPGGSGGSEPWGGKGDSPSTGKNPGASQNPAFEEE
ncbi:MAG: hypothetical protein ACYDBQ_08435 [Thermoplasmatota archaeon]